MDTKVLEVHTNDSHDPAIQEAVRLLQAGEVVAIPTETVYGLAANALNADIVQKIFEAKGRPANNPLIVHVAATEHAKDLVAEWPPIAEKLAAAFWPGPLTLVLKKADVVPDNVTAGGDTVAIRCPANAVALSVISACAFPLAAPSANRSNCISPTTAVHVARSLSGRIPLVLDGGPCEAGIESTVVSLSEDSLAILRPGSISAAQLEAVADMPVNTTGGAGVESGPAISPGLLPVHYAPTTPLVLVEATEMKPEIARLHDQGKKIGVMAVAAQPELSAIGKSIRMPADAEEYARKLYAVMHDLDAEQLDVILCEVPPAEIEWQAVRDRLFRAGCKSHS